MSHEYSKATQRHLARLRRWGSGETSDREYLEDAAYNLAEQLRGYAGRQTEATMLNTLEGGAMRHTFGEAAHDIEAMLGALEDAAYHAQHAVEKLDAIQAHRNDPRNVSERDN